MCAGWWSSLLVPRVHRLRHKHSLYVRCAYAPEDYMHENIPCSWFARVLRRTTTRAIIVAILLITAAIITVLETINKREARVITWLPQHLSDSVGKAASQGLNMNAASVSNQTRDLFQLYQASGYVNQQTAIRLGASAVPEPTWSSYCNMSLDVCTDYYRAVIGVSTFDMPWADTLQWSNQTERLIKQRAVMASLQACTAGSDPECATANLALQGCMACYCMGLSTIQDTTLKSTAWIKTAKSDCADFIDNWDLKNWGLRVSVALVIAIINYALKVVIEFLVRFEKHWTKTDEVGQSEHECSRMSNLCSVALWCLQLRNVARWHPTLVASYVVPTSLHVQEQTYAFMVFVAQLLNSALVLLLVNASPAADVTNQETVRQLCR